MAAERNPLDLNDDIRPQDETLEGLTATDDQDSAAGSEQEGKYQEKRRGKLSQLEKLSALGGKSSQELFRIRDLPPSICAPVTRRSTRSLGAAAAPSPQPIEVSRLKFSAQTDLKGRC